MVESDEFILVMDGISKDFPGVQALENVSLTLKRLPDRTCITGPDCLCTGSPRRDRSPGPKGLDI